jgi:hypothetical protein
MKNFNSRLSCSIVISVVSIPLRGIGYEKPSPVARPRDVSRAEEKVSIPLRGIGYEKRDTSPRRSFSLREKVSIPLRGIGYEKLRRLKK